MNFKKRVNGSWTDIPHYVHNTSTDTITTPADIYANDDNATVGIKGNMYQASGVSPTTPIQPQECGDLETTGTYAGQYKIPILNGSQTTNIYLGEVQTTRKIKKLVLTGEGDGWVKNSTITSGNTFYNTSLFTGYKPSTRGVCTHYKTVTSISATEGVYWGANINIITDFAEGIDTADKWKEYLAAQYAAGTPVCVWYVLATEETAVVNEPIRKIGDYVDTVSGITIPTTAGANAVDVLTTLKPSEVSVNYKGWHPVTNTHVMAGLLADNPLCGIDTYKDELDLATGGCTRRIKKLVLTGEETGWINVGGNAPYRLPINDIVASSSASSIEWCCSHYMAVPNNASWSSYDYCISRSSTTAQSLQFRDVTKADTTAFKQYLAQQYANGTPVTIWCVLATPTTETITVPSGLSGTEEGYLNQSGTPTPTNPIYPTANEVPMWN